MRVLRRQKSDARTSTSKRRLLSRSVIWLATTVAAAIIGVIVTLNASAIQSWFSTKESVKDPLRVDVSFSKQYPDSYSMVVPDPSRLRRGVGEINDCAALWDVGLAAGGINPTSPRILLQGKAKDGVAITDMRAKITKREPAIDGALLLCPSAGGINPIGLQFDLRSSDPASAEHFDPNSDQLVPQFTEGYTVSVANNESVPLDTEVTLPDDAVYWHIEADLLVGGEHRALIINNNGKDFFSPGSRLLNRYSKGYGAGVSPQNWGIDDNARHVQLSGGITALQLGSAIFPDTNGLDVYQPSEYDETSTDSSPYRWIRRETRKILEFNPDGVSARPLPMIGDICSSGLEGEDPNIMYGRIESQNVAISLVRDHNGQPFRHVIMNIDCQLYDGPKQTYRFQAAWPINGNIAFSFSSNEVADQDQPYAERLLNDIRVAR